MALTFPVTVPAGVAAEPAWLNYRNADGLYYPYPHWLGLEYLREADGGIVAAIASPAEESQLSRLTVWRASDENGAVDAADSVEIEANNVSNISMSRRSDGILDLFYILRTVPAPPAYVLLHRFSRDGGRTWSASLDVAPAAASGPLSVSGRSEGATLSNDNIFIPYLAHAVTRDGLLVMALDASAAPVGRTTWVGGADVTGERWSFGTFRETDVLFPELVVTYPWGLIEFAAGSGSERAYSRFSKTSHTAAPAVWGASPGCIDHRRGGAHSAVRLGGGSDIPQWYVQTGRFGEVPYGPWAHQILPAFYAQTFLGRYYHSTAARMAVREDGALELFYVAPGGVPTISRLRNTSPGSAATEPWV